MYILKTLKQFKNITGIKDKDRLEKALIDFKNYKGDYMTESEKIESWLRNRLNLFATDSEL
ncbi:MAG: hypothetical protein WC917_02605 [Bacilli bacterium]|jgi:hypothetical protein